MYNIILRTSDSIGIENRTGTRYNEYAHKRSHFNGDPSCIDRIGF